MTAGLSCQAVSQASIGKFRSGLQYCFQHANQLGLDISIVPHLDEGVRTNAAWRNTLVFDPAARWTTGSFVAEVWRGAGRMPAGRG